MGVPIQSNPMPIDTLSAARASLAAIRPLSERKAQRRQGFACAGPPAFFSCGCVLIPTHSESPNRPRISVNLPSLDPSRMAGPSLRRVVDPLASPKGRVSAASWRPAAEARHSGEPADWSTRRLGGGLDLRP
jgi:hypothetical protein